MSFKVEKHPVLPCISTTFNEDYDLAGEFSQMVQEIVNLLEQSETSLFLIMVFKADFSIDEMIQGANDAARGPSPLFHHPQIRQIIFVTNDPMLKSIAEGMGTQSFGNLKIRLQSTLQEAVEFVQANP